MINIVLRVRAIGTLWACSQCLDLKIHWSDFLGLMNLPLAKFVSIWSEFFWTLSSWSSNNSISFGTNSSPAASKRVLFDTESSDDIRLMSWRADLKVINSAFPKIEPKRTIKRCNSVWGWLHPLLRLYSVQIQKYHGFRSPHLFYYSVRLRMQIKGQWVIFVDWSLQLMVCMHRGSVLSKWPLFPWPRASWTHQKIEVLV